MLSAQEFAAIVVEEINTENKLNEFINDHHEYYVVPGVNYVTIKKHHWGTHYPLCFIAVKTGNIYTPDHDGTGNYLPGKESTYTTNDIYSFIEDFDKNGHFVRNVKYYD